MDTRRLQYFVDIVNAGSITKAASLAGVAQAALSQQLAILENEFRCTLLKRSRTGVQLTATGQVVFREAHSVLRRMEELRELVRREATEVCGVVSIGLTTTNVALLAADLMRRVRARHPGIVLRIIEGMSGDLAEGIVHEQLDFATLTKEEARDGVVCSEMMSVTLFATASPSFGLGAHIALADLARLPLILPTARQPLRARYDALFVAAGIDALPVAETDSVHVMKAAVLAGTAVAILPRSIWLEEEADERVTLSSIADHLLRHHVWLAKRRPPHAEAVLAVEHLLLDAIAAHRDT